MDESCEECNRQFGEKRDDENPVRRWTGSAWCHDCVNRCIERMDDHHACMVCLDVEHHGGR